MTPHQIQLVKSSFTAVAAHRDAAARLFYAHLFGAMPTLRPMFPLDLAEQRRKLVAALAFVVGNLERGEALVPAIEALAVRHIDYGVEDAHYPLVGAALLAMLAELLGPGFDPEVREAWAAAYTLLSDVMISAAGRAGESAPAPGVSVPA